MNHHLSFHTIIALAYTIPNIYLFFRISRLFISKGYKLYYSLIYLLIFFIYPAGDLISWKTAGSIKYILAVITNYLLPFYLYLFLSLLAFEIFLLLNRIFKIVPVEKLKRPWMRTICLSSILFLSLATLTAGVINFNTIRTSEYRIKIPARSSAITHLRIAFAADFHLKDNTDIHFVERFAEKVKIIHPDLMVFGGDIVEGNRENAKMLPYETILSTISARYGVYAVLGNHEFYAGRYKGTFFNKAGMKLLCDTIVEIGGLFNLAGRLDSHFNEREAVNDLIKGENESLPLILIDHSPTEISQVSKTDVDIQLSGHTHNGQLFPINLITRCIYDLSWGYMKRGNTNFFVTSGIRLWGPPVRTAGKSEIMVIDVDFVGK